MKTWLKGGLIGAVIGFTIWLISFILTIRNFNVTGILLFLSAPSCFVLTEWGEPRAFCWFLFGHITNIILFFIIGAIIGFAIGKIKSKKEE